MAGSKTAYNEDKRYFILMSECQAEKRVRNSLFARSRDTEITTALPGSLWYLTESELSNLTQSKANRRATFHSAEQPDYCLHKNELNDIIQLSVQEFQLLLAVTTCKERATIYKAQEGKLLQYACKLLEQWNSGNREELLVEISDDADSQERLKGELKYAGSVPELVGYWFAVDLPLVYKGNLQTTDGIYDGHELFSCRKEHTVLVAVNRIILARYDSGFTLKSCRYDGTQHAVNGQEMLQTCKPPELQLGERIVWINPSNDVEHGTVLWIGKLPDSCAAADEYVVGVQFDNPVGSGCGTYKGCRLFDAPMNHASLIPVNGLLKAIDYYGDNTFVPAAPVLQPPTKDDAKDGVSDAGFSATSSSNYDVSALAGDNNSKLNDANVDNISKPGHAADQSAAQSEYASPVSVAASELGTDLDVGSLVEVHIPGSKQSHFGVIRWMGVLRDRDKPFVGVELEEENVAGTDGIFGRTRLFSCAAKHAVFVHLHRVSKDMRFAESSHMLDRTDSHG